MKKVYLFIGLMLSALAIGCTNNGTEDQNQPAQGGNKDVVVTVNATLPSDLVWAEGDKVAVNGLESSAVTAEGAGGATYAFTAAKTTAPVVVVAPFEIMTGLGEVTLPATQEYVADGFDRAAYGMAAIAPELTQVGEDEKNLEASVNLLPVMGVVSLPLTLDSATAENAVAVKQVSFTAIGGAAINGVWNAEATTATDEAGVTTYDVKLTAVKGSTSTNLDCGEGVAIDTVAPAYFNLVVPAGTYTGGFEIVVTDTADHNFVLALAEDVVVERGAVVELAPSVFTVVDKAPATLTVTIAEQGMTWLEGDAIVCNNSLSTNTVAADAAGTQTAQFSFDAVAYPYSVFYPAEYYTTSGSLRFYDEQPLIKDGYDRKNMVMVGYSNTNEVTLNNLCGVVTIPITNKYEGENVIIDKIEVATSEGDPIAGKYHINYRTGDLTVVSGKSSIVLEPEVEDSFTIAPEATVNVSFVVPRGSIRNGLKLNIYSSVGLLENHKIFPTGVTVRGGEVATADAYVYKEVKIDAIRTAAELVDFAKCVNMGRYKKYVNEEGKVVLGGDIDMSSISAENWPMIKGVEVEGVPTGFDGIFDGCGFALKNWTATMPLFHSVAATGKVCNIVIDSSCDLVVPAEPAYPGLSGSNAFAFIVAHLAGEIENITNNADARYVTSNHPATILGLISGNPAAGANVRNCVNNGNFTLEIGNHKNGTGYFGTVCGRMIEDANHPTCGIFNCKNYGNLTITIVDANTDANCYIGGVTGSSNSYTVTEGCENYGNISFTTEQSNNAVLLAGVTSYSAGPVRNCINEGNVSFYSKGSYKSSIISGIASYVNGPISDCVNKGDITLKAEKNFAGRNSIGGIDGKSSSSTSAPACSGVCGYGYTSATSVFTMDRCSNYGKITYHWTDATGSGTSGYPMAAGVVSAPRGNVTDCHNYGDIDANFGNSGATIKLISYYGGVVAADVYAVKEQSSTSVYNCTNSGNITVHNDVCDASNNALGGIIGWPGSETKASCTNETKGCTNTGNITMSGKGKFRCGCIQGGSGRVIDCVNSGNLTINSSAAGSAFGGLAGFHSGGYELTGSTNTGNIVANCVLASGGVGGMAGNLGNAAHAVGLIANNTIKCIVKAPEGTCGIGMVCGHYNGKTKVINFGSEAAPLKIGGSIQIGENLTVVDASNVMDPAVLGNTCSNYDATYHLFNCVLAE